MSNLNWCQAILLDLDGTLIDSEAGYEKLWKKTASEFGINLTDQMYARFVGARYDHCKDYMAEIGGEGFDREVFVDRLEVHGAALFEQGMPLKAGVEALFEKLNAGNRPFALVTSSRMEIAQMHMQQHPCLTGFTTLVTGDQVDTPKPNPKPYLIACERLKIEPSAALGVEDSMPGLRSVLAAGCKSLLIPDGPIDPQIAGQADYRFDSLLPLVELL